MKLIGLMGLLDFSIPIRQTHQINQFDVRGRLK